MNSSLVTRHSSLERANALRGCVRRSLGEGGFTLLELIIVAGIMIFLTVLTIPAFTSRSDSAAVNKGSETIKGVLDQARAYAQANNTYAWVGFYEENGDKPSQNPAQAGTGRLVMAIVASTDGTNLGADVSNTGATGTNNFLDATKLTQVGNIVKIDNAHLPLFTIPTGINCSTTPCDTFDTRPEIPKECFGVDYNCSRFGDLNAAPPNTAPYDPTNNGLTRFPFKCPIINTGNTTQYTFQRTVRFSPTGENRINSTYDVRRVVEVGLVKSRGSIVPNPLPANVAAIQIGGFQGDVKIYRR